MTSDEPEPYVGDVAATNDAHAATQIQGLGSAHNVYGDVGNAVQGALIQSGANVRTAQWGQAQAARLEQGVETQSAPPFGGSNYAHLTTSQLCDMVTTNIDPGAVGELGAAWHGIGETYTAVAQSLGAAVSSSESGWTGTAGDAARQFLTGLANWADLAGQGAQLAGNRTGMQSEAAQAARNSMPTPVEPPTTADVRQVLLSNALNPALGAAALDQQFQAAQQAHDQAVQVVQTYDTNLAAVGDTMPAFAVPPMLDPGNAATSHSAQSPRPQATATPTPQQQAPAEGQQSRSAPQSSRSGTPEPGDSTAPGGAETLGPQGNPGLGGTSVGGAGGSGGTTFGGDAGAGGGSGAATFGGGSGDGAFGGARFGGPDTFGAPGMGKTGGPAGSGRAAGPTGSGGPGRPGGSAGSGAASEAAADRPVTGPGSGAGAGGDEGVPGVPFGRGGRSDEDRDRYPPSFLTNPDPDGTFGITQNVTPPVIGA